MQIPAYGLLLNITKKYRLFMKNILARPGSILDETIGEIREILGSDFDSITVERVVIGIFFTGLKLSDGSAGLCYTPTKEIPDAVCCPSSARAMPYTGRFTGRRAGEFLPNLHNPPHSKKRSALPSSTPFPIHAGSAGLTPITPVNLARMLSIHYLCRRRGMSLWSGHSCRSSNDSRCGESHLGSSNSTCIR